MPINYLNAAIKTPLTDAIVALPDILAALADLVSRCDGFEGVREDGSNIDTRAAHAALAKAGYPRYEPEEPSLDDEARTNFYRDIDSGLRR